MFRYIFLFSLFLCVGSGYVVANPAKLSSEFEEVYLIRIHAEFPDGFVSPTNYPEESTRADLTREEIFTKLHEQYFVYLKAQKPEEAAKTLVALFVNGYEDPELANVVESFQDGLTRRIMQLKTTEENQNLAELITALTNGLKGTIRTMINAGLIKDKK